MPPTDSSPPASSVALVSMVIGEVDYATRTLPLLQAWARREGWDFHRISERRFRCNPNWPRGRFGLHIEKYQLHDFLGRYERVIYVDADVLVHPSVPDLLDRVPPGAVGGVWDDTGEDAWKREEALARLARKHGPLPERTGPRFLNAGVLVLGAAHRDLWRFVRTDFVRGRWPDQSLFNYRRLATRTPVCALPPEFNLMPLHAKQWHDPAARRAAHLVHYASQPAKAQLDQDLPFFEASWAAADGSLNCESRA